MYPLTSGGQWLVPVEAATAAGLARRGTAAAERAAMRRACFMLVPGLSLWRGSLLLALRPTSMATAHGGRPFAFLRIPQAVRGLPLLASGREAPCPISY